LAELLDQQHFNACKIESKIKVLVLILLTSLKKAELIFKHFVF